MIAMVMHTIQVTYDPTTRRMSYHSIAGGVLRGEAL